MNESSDNRKKQWLRRYIKLSLAEERLKNKLKLLEQSIINIRSSKIDGMPRGGISVTTGDLIADKEDLINRIDKAHVRVVQCKHEILEVIDKLEDPTHADILEDYFINGETIDTIAETLGYNTRHVYRLYSEAIKKIDLSVFSGET